MLRAHPEDHADLADRHFPWNRGCGGGLSAVGDRLKRRVPIRDVLLPGEGRLPHHFLLVVLLAPRVHRPHTFFLTALRWIG